MKPLDVINRGFGGSQYSDLNQVAVERVAQNEGSKSYDSAVRTQERIQYIDVASAMFDTTGNLRADLFVEDGLHPTQKCYALWTSIIKPVLLQRFGLEKTVGQIPTERYVAFGRLLPTGRI